MSNSEDQGAHWNMERALTEPPAPLHPLSGANWRILRKHASDSTPYTRRTTRVRAVAQLCNTLRAPLTLIEQKKYGEAIAASDPERGPVFIIGHWRSGTTFLHNVLSSDPRFGYLRFWQAALPHQIMLSGRGMIIPRIIQANLPETRGIDHVPISIHTPWEDEVALGNLNPISYFNCLYFPKDTRRHFRRSILFDGVSEEEKQAFGEACQLLVRKLTLHYGGKPLILKNPPSTARLLFLKGLFPKARFVHIVRNPFEVFASSVDRFPRVWSLFSWQDFSGCDPENIAMKNYRLLMQQYLRQAPQLASTDLMEVRFEDLEAEPQTVAARIMKWLNLPGMGRELAPEVTAYLETQRHYRKNQHQISSRQKERIEQEWEFALERWGYQCPDDLVKGRSKALVNT